ncbi:MAG: hypothetical protein K6F13_04700 [Lachnospiraceae bacterium]|nr:hypothetical protein [Lachnospiraceae bacterium]
MANDDFRELSLDDLEDVAGGFTFESHSVTDNWMDGYEIKCPHCGNDAQELIHKGATIRRNTMYFICNKCGKSFHYRVDKKLADGGQWAFDVTTDKT